MEKSGSTIIYREKTTLALAKTAIDFIIDSNDCGGNMASRKRFEVPRCVRCQQPISLGVAHKCPQQGNPLNWKWAASAIIVLFLQLGTFLMAFGALQQKVDALDKRLERMEQSFDKIYIKP